MLTKPTVYFTDTSGNKWPTYTAALLAEAIQSHTYLESYKLESVVEAILKHFIVKEKKQDETLSTSTSD